MWSDCWFSIVKSCGSPSLCDIVGWTPWLWVLVIVYSSNYHIHSNRRPCSNRHPLPLHQQAFGTQKWVKLMTFYQKCLDQWWTVFIFTTTLFYDDVFVVKFWVYHFVPTLSCSHPVGVYLNTVKPYSLAYTSEKISHVILSLINTLVWLTISIERHVYWFVSGKGLEDWISGWKSCSNNGFWPLV